MPWLVVGCQPSGDCERRQGATVRAGRPMRQASSADRAPRPRNVRAHADVVAVVAVGGALGSLARWAVGLGLGATDSVFPWATFIVNAGGSLILGVTAGAVAAMDGPEWVLTLVGVGVCGAMTTFSTSGYETVRLLEEGFVLPAALNVSASVTVAMTVYVGGWALMNGLA